MQQPNVRLRSRPHSCSRTAQQRHLWEAALCLLLLCQLPAEAARSASAHRLARQRALKASQAASSDGSSQLKSGPSSQGIDRITSQGLDRSSSQAAHPSSLVSTSDTTVVNPGILPTASNQASSMPMTSELDAAVNLEQHNPGRPPQLTSERTPSGSSPTDSAAVFPASGSSSSSSYILSRNASAPGASPPPSRNVSSQPEPKSGKLTGLAAASPPVKGTSEAAWLNVSLEFPSNAKAPHNYAEALHKSLLFYWAQRSGPMPVRRLAWRSDSCLECVGDHGEVSPCLFCTCSLLMYTHVPALTIAW